MKIFRLFLLIIITTGTISLLNNAHAELFEWKVRNPSELSQVINSIAYGNDRFVACSTGNLFSSTDLVTWRKSTLKTELVFSKIKFIEGKFYGFADIGHVYSSSDGITWINETIGTSQRIYDISYGMGFLVAVGYEGIFVSEYEGSWKYVGTEINAQLTGIAYGNGIFLAVGKNGKIFYSLNCSEWVPVDLNLADDFYAITFANGRFVATSDRQTKNGKSTIVGPSMVMSTTDGVSWSVPFSYDARMTSVIWKNGMFWGAAYNSIVCSADGVTWKKNQLHTNSYLSEIIDGGNNFVGINRNQGISISNDAKYWEPVLAGTRGRLQSVSYFNGLFVAVGINDGILTSKDGKVWKNERLKIRPNNGAFDTVLNLNDKIIAIGKNSIFSSVDGVNWTNIYNTNAFGAAPHRAALGQDSLVIGCLNGKILRTTDAKTWTIIDTGMDGIISAIAYGSGVFVALVEKKAMIKSIDNGKTWEIIKLDDSIVLPNLAYGNGIFLLEMNNKNDNYKQHLYFSNDSNTWNEIKSDKIPCYIRNINFTNNKFLAIAGDTIYSTLDGTDWDDLDARGFGYINSVVFGVNTYVAVGDSGMIIQTQAY